MSMFTCGGWEAGGPEDREISRLVLGGACHLVISVSLQYFAFSSCPINSPAKLTVPSTVLRAAPFVSEMVRLLPSGAQREQEAF